MAGDVGEDHVGHRAEFVSARLVVRVEDNHHARAERADAYAATNPACLGSQPAPPGLQSIRQRLDRILRRCARPNVFNNLSNVTRRRLAATHSLSIADATNDGQMKFREDRDRVARGGSFLGTICHVKRCGFL